jgi:uncharacterized repeat protein (TIGR03803 family)
MRSRGRNSGTTCRLNISHVGPRVSSAKLAATVLRGALTLAVLSTLLLIPARPAQAQTERLLHDFKGASDGGEPYSRLTSDGAGNFYGTTEIGGQGYGTVFELSPNGRGGWNEIVLHTFTNYLDGGYPFFTALIFDCVGNLYGTAYSGGPNGSGVVFKLTPKGKRWAETVLYSFGSEGGPPGAHPFNGVIMDAAGNLYGTFLVNGLPTNEAVYELSPSDGNGGWTLNVIYTFDAPADNNGGGGLTMDARGNIFAVLSAAYDSPAIVELSPDGHGGWNPTVLRIFGNNIFPEGAPVLDKAGNLYGTTQAGGASNMGAVYRLSPGKNGAWTEKVLYAFRGGKKDGIGPYAGIAFDAAGNIYGTTIFGGESNKGTVFELVAPVGKGSYKEKVLRSFNGADGSGPLGSLILDSGGNLYGMTPSGGGTGCYALKGCGVAFELAP